MRAACVDEEVQCVDWRASCCVRISSMERKGPVVRGEGVVSGEV